MFKTPYKPFDLEPVKEFNPEDKVLRSASYLTDISSIYNQYCNNGELPVVRQMNYDDCTNLPTSFVEAQEVVNATTAYFESLPADIRNQFGNDINRFVASANQPDTFQKLGLLKNVVVNDDLAQDNLTIKGRGDSENSQNVVESQSQTVTQEREVV